MPLTITKSYEENAELKPYHHCKVGLTISSDKVFSSPEEVESASAALGTMAKNLVRKELAKLKQEAQNSQ